MPPHRRIIRVPPIAKVGIITAHETKKLNIEKSNETSKNQNENQQNKGPK